MMFKRWKAGTAHALVLAGAATLGSCSEEATVDHVSRAAQNRVPEQALAPEDLGDGPESFAKALQNRQQLHALEDALIESLCQISHDCCDSWGYGMVFGCEHAAYQLLYRDKVPLPDSQQSHYTFNDLYAARCTSAVEDMVGHCRFDGWEFALARDTCGAVVQPAKVAPLVTEQTLPSSPMECGRFNWHCLSLHGRWDMACVDYQCREPTYVGTGDACDASAALSNGHRNNTAALRLCQPDHYCKDGACAPKGTENAPCQTYTDCQPGLYCQGGELCAPRHPVGDRCAAHGIPCAAGLHCSAITRECVANHESMIGDPCTTLDECPVLARDPRFDFPADLAVTCHEGRCGGDALRFTLCGDANLAYR